MSEDTLKLSEQESSQGEDLSDRKMKEMMDAYSRTLNVPERKPDKQIILCPVGLVGAGKTTVIKPICEELGFLRVSTDEIRGMLMEKGFNLERTMEIGYRLLEGFLGQGYSVACDADCISPKVQDKIAELQEEKGVTPIWIHIDPPYGFMVDKLKNYDHTWLFRDADEAVANLERRKPLHDKHLKDIDFYFTFDTSRSNIQDQIREFVERLEKDYDL